MLKRYQLKDYKFSLILLTAAASVYGIIMIGSAQQAVQKKQIVGLAVALIIMAVISIIDYKWVLSLHWLIYAGNIFQLLLVRFLGDESKGAQRWLDIAGIRFQPSELSKILLILFFARLIVQHRHDLNKPKTLIMMAGLAAVPLFLIYNQPDLSTTIISTIIICILFYVGGLSYKIIGGILAVVIPVVVIFLTIVVQPDQTLIEPYQQKRILAWLHPEEYGDAVNQQENSVTAIGSGQLRGKGLNNNAVASVKNGNFIPEPQTDFIFAVIGEELGFIGSSAAISLLFLISASCILIGRKAQDEEGRLICSGMAALIAFQSFINIGVATQMLPNTGLPLPFFSYGLTSLVSVFIGIGFVLNVGLQPKKY